ncbi:MAG: hypothetical protein ACXWQO_09975 [Bdellovibrionota bacterium]
MNKKIIYLAISLAVAISAAAFVFNKKFPNPNGEPQPAVEDTNAGIAAGTTPPSSLNGTAGNQTQTQTSATGVVSPSSGPSLPVNDEAAIPVTSKWAEVPLSKEEIKSVKMLSATLIKFVDPKMGNPDLLVKEFTKAGLQPVIAKDFNQYTGKMIVVRCNNPPPGTRCCHAQYFEDENKKSFLQHISYEMRPSPNGMEVAAASLDAILAPHGVGKLGKPVTKTQDLAHWELKNNFSATIMKLKTAADMKDDPFCAHDPAEDIGMYKVMAEMVPDKDDEAPAK